MEQMDFQQVTPQGNMFTRIFIQFTANLSHVTYSAQRGKTDKKHISVARSMGQVLLPRSIYTAYSQCSHPSIYCRYGCVCGSSSVEHPRLVRQYSAGVSPVTVCIRIHRTTATCSQGTSRCDFPLVLCPIRHRPLLWIARRGNSSCECSRNILVVNDHCPARLGRSNGQRCRLRRPSHMKHNLRDRFDPELKRGDPIHGIVSSRRETPTNQQTASNTNMKEGIPNHSRRTVIRIVGATALSSSFAGCLGGARDDSSATQSRDERYVEDPSDYDGWFDGVENYRGTVDGRGQRRWSYVSAQVVAECPSIPLL